MFFKLINILAIALISYCPCWAYRFIKNNIM
jgi:hypothetical protein